MQSSNLPAQKFGTIFANAAGTGFIRTVPVASQIGVQAGAASFTDGFPPATFLPVTAGGTPPFGQDFNGLLNAMTAWLRWVQAGGSIGYDSGFSASIGGYPQGALVKSASDGAQFWLSAVDNNTTNPDTGGAGWVAEHLIPFTPVQQGTGVGQSANTVKIGWSSAAKTKVTIDSSDQGNIAMEPWVTSIFAPINSPTFITAAYAPTPAAIFDQSTRIPNTAWTYQILADWPHGEAAFGPGFSVFTVPANVFWIFVRVWGAGGGGAGSQSGTDAAGGGGGGGYTEGWVNIGPGNTIGITVGSHGGGGLGNSSNAGGNGGTTSFGPYFSATGGIGGTGAAPGGLGPGGTAGGAFGGTTPAAGGVGGGGFMQAGMWIAGAGGYAPFGGSTITGNNAQGSTGAGPGGGGTGGANGGGGGDGGDGYVIVRW